MIGLNGGLIGRPRSLYANTGIWTPNEQRLSKNDPYWDSVSLLLHMNGANASTTFTDSSKNNFTATVNGNAQISTAQSKFGGASGLFDGTGDYLSLSSSSLFDIFGGDMTIECWIYSQNNSSNKSIIELFIDANQRGSLGLVSGSLTFYSQNNSSNGGTRISTSAPSLNTWAHVALVKSGSTFALYLDGISAGTSTTSIYPTGSLTCRVGAYYTAGFEYQGHIDDLRITKGVARYTANFTPPTAPFPDA